MDVVNLCTSPNEKTFLHSPREVFGEPNNPACLPVKKMVCVTAQTRVANNVNQRHFPSPDT